MVPVVQSRSQQNAVNSLNLDDEPATMSWNKTKKGGKMAARPSLSQVSEDGSDGERESDKSDSPM